jgi:hypothetical protein
MPKLLHSLIVVGAIRDDEYDNRAFQRSWSKRNA